MRCLLLALAILLAATSAALADPAAAALDEALLGRGRKLLDMHGCTACHSLDGSVSAGPTFYARYGKIIDVLVDDRPEKRLFDAAYMRESLEEPGRVITVGFPRGVMPRFTLTDEQLGAMTATIAHLGDAPPLEAPEPGRPSPMRWLALFVLLFVGGHLILSSAPVRSKLVARLGEYGFQGLYSAVVTLALIGTVWAFGNAPYNKVWPALVWTRYVPLVTMPFALFFLIAGITTRTPTQIGQADALKLPDPAVGVLRITRHPQLWGYVLFALSHMPPNGDAAALLFFGAFGALAVLGMVHIEHRRQLTHGQAWLEFEARTSIVPFGAILEKRNKLVLREIGWWRFALAAAIYAVLLLGHGWLFGASPLP
jgi:uncharacterized membrane protein/mono/diheme cytochrome c family protein